MCPFSSWTRKVVLGSASTTRPSMLIASSFDMYFPFLYDFEIVLLTTAINSEALDVIDLLPLHFTAN